MSDHSEEILKAVNEIRDLIQLMAEPQIAARDQKLRDELKRIVGRSEASQKSVILMDGTNSQLDVHKKTGVHKGNLSTLVKRLMESKLLVGYGKQQKL